MKRWALALAGLALGLTGCASERQYGYDTIWPFGNPNAPVAASETAQRAIGHKVAMAPLAPQAGDVWPGPVQPVPTISDEQRNMTEPLGQAFTPSLPSPYPPGMSPPANADLGLGPMGSSASSDQLMAPGVMAPPAPGVMTPPTGAGMQPGILPPAMPVPAGSVPVGSVPVGSVPAGSAPAGSVSGSGSGSLP